MKECMKNVEKYWKGGEVKENVGNGGIRERLHVEEVKRGKVRKEIKEKWRSGKE